MPLEIQSLIERSELVDGRLAMGDMKITVNDDEMVRVQHKFMVYYRFTLID